MSDAPLVSPDTRLAAQDVNEPYLVSGRGSPLAYDAGLDWPP